MADLAWSSPLGLSVTLFLVAASIHVLIGVATPFVLHLGPRGPGGLLFSARTDAVAFGPDAVTRVEQDPGLAKAHVLTLDLLAGLMLALGVCELLLAWFGLRAGQAWAFAALTASAIIMLVYGGFVFSRYVASGVVPSLGDLPPFLWVHVGASVPAIAAGAWAFLRGS